MVAVMSRPSIENKIFSPACTTGCAREQKKPPHAAAVVRSVANKIIDFILWSKHTHAISPRRRSSAPHWDAHQCQSIASSREPSTLLTAVEQNLPDYPTFLLRETSAFSSKKVIIGEPSVFSTLWNVRVQTLECFYNTLKLMSLNSKI